MRLRQASLHVLVRDGPGDDESVGPDATMQRAIGVAVHILDVLGGAHTEDVEVEMGVACDEWIVRPVDDRSAEIMYDAALVFLEAASESEVAGFGANSEHVGPVDDAPILDTSEAVHETEQSTLGIEGASSDSADPLRHLQNACRHNIGERGTPGLPLQLDASAQLGERAEGVNVDSGSVHQGRVTQKGDARDERGS